MILMNEMLVTGCLMALSLLMYLCVISIWRGINTIWIKTWARLVRLAKAISVTDHQPHGAHCQSGNVPVSPCLMIVNTVQTGGDI